MPAASATTSTRSDLFTATFLLFRGIDCNQRGFLSAGQAFPLVFQGFFIFLDASAPDLQGFSLMQSLADGEYDGIVVDASDTGDGAVALEIAISSGAQKGNTVVVRARNIERDALNVLALPVTLKV